MLYIDELPNTPLPSLCWLIKLSGDTMKIPLMSLVDACVQTHMKSSTTKDAMNSFKALIQQAYEIGVRDEKEEEKSRQESSSKEKSQESQISNKSCDKKSQEETGTQKNSQSKTESQKGKEESNKEIKANGPTGPVVLTEEAKAALSNF